MLNENMLCEILKDWNVIKLHIATNKDFTAQDPLVTLHTSQAVADQLRDYAQISPAEAMLMEEYVITKTEE